MMDITGLYIVYTLFIQVVKWLHIQGISMYIPCKYQPHGTHLHIHGIYMVPFPGVPDETH